MNASRPNTPAAFFPPNKPLLIVLSGPSGAGKDTILSQLKKSGYPIEFITTLTTRPRRAREKDKVSYHFVSVETFKQMIAGNELLEWASVYGNWYGVPREPIKRGLESGRDALVKVDVQGAATIKKILPQAVLICVVPSSLAELSARLRERHSESPFDLALRLKTADDEMKQLPLFDYVIVNEQGKLDQAVSAVVAIITAEKHRAFPREVSL